MAEPSPRPQDAPSGLILLFTLSLLLCLPILLLDHVPSTDLPQHGAVLRSLSDLLLSGEPGPGWAHLQPSLYLLPYLLGLPLVAGMGAMAAMKAALFLATLLYPLSIGMILRARAQSPLLGLFALPFVYNRAFFWGFIAFQLGVGLALMAFALLLTAPGRRGRAGGIVALGILSGISHPYGPAILLGLFACLSLARRRIDRSAALALTPAALLLGAWGVLGALATGDPAQGSSPDLWTRLRTLPETLGLVYTEGDGTTLLLLALGGLLIALLRRGAGEAGADPARRALILFACLNGILYLLLPESTPKSAFLHFRHGLLATLLLPAALCLPTRYAPARLTLGLGLLLALLALQLHPPHLYVFDTEARAIEPILAALPASPRVAYLPFDNQGALLTTHPYLHAGALAQAAQGGLVLPDFPHLFWNLPVGRAEGPSLPKGIEWRPGLLDPAGLPPEIDLLLLRTPSLQGVASPLRQLGYEPIVSSPPYHLYLAPGRAPQAPGGAGGARVPVFTQVH